MIKGIMGSNGVIIDGGATSLPYVNQNSNDSFSGLVRIHGTDLQCYQNGAWISIPSSYATVRLDASVDSVLNWARDKMAFENSEKASRNYMKSRAMQFPSLQKALEAVERAEAERDSEVKEALANFHLLDKIAGQDADVNQPMSQ